MLPYLFNSLKQLEDAGADFIILPCNTLNSLLPKLREKTFLPFLDLVEETNKEIKKYNKVGILATSKTIDIGLYNQKGEENKVVYPDKEVQERISKVILKIISGKHSLNDKIFLEEVIDNFRIVGCEKVILACTDLANILEKNDFIIDTQDILIKSILRRMKDL